MKIIKSKQHPILTDDHLRITLTTYNPNFKKLLKKNNMQ